MSASELSSRYQRISSRVAELGGSKACLLAVSKTQPVSAIRALYDLGHRDFGENYVQEMVEKAEELLALGCSGIRWHFIGHLQTNKVKALMPWVHSVHSLDSLRLAGELAKRWAAAGRSGQLPVYLETNIDGEGSKSGVAPAGVPALAAQVAGLKELSVEGLMCIPSPESDARAAFVRLRELELTCRPHTRGGLSMGMSSDFEVALGEGSTCVRVGTSLFGPRS